MKPILYHIDTIARPGFRRYATAEKALTVAQIVNDAVAIRAARGDARSKRTDAVTVIAHSVPARSVGAPPPSGLGLRSTPSDQEQRLFPSEVARQ
jgi:hypothetical protein